MRRLVKTRSELAILAAALLALSAYSTISGVEAEEASGKLQDRGSRLLVKRYIMDLGTIDLNQVQERHFDVDGLPGDREFILGINIEKGDCAIEKSDMRVSINMTNELGKSVIHEDRPLQEFTWATRRDECAPAFGYIRGKAREVPMNKQGDVCMRPIITGADNGRGTYFVARKSAGYKITVKVQGKVAGQPVSHLAKIRLEDNGPKADVTNCP